MTNPLSNIKSSIFSVDNEQQFSLYEQGNSKFDITFSVVEGDKDYFVSINYNSNVYESNIINNIIDSYIEVINNIKSYNDKIYEIEYIPKEEKERIIEEFNNDKFESKCNKLYHEEFSKVAKKYPQRCAIVDNYVKISYGELDKMSNSFLAHYLRDIGIERNDIVPIICDRSYYFVISMIAISKAGGAFLPIDNTFPVDCIQYILEEANPKIIIYCHTQDIIYNMRNDGYKMYDLESHNYKLNKKKIKNINKPEDIYYVLFISGTTGRPKGVLINHFNIYNYLRKFVGKKRKFGGKKGKEEKRYCLYKILIKENNIHNVLALTSFSFDISHNEITFSLVHGLKIILADDILSNDAELLTKYIIKNNVEFIDTTPTRFKLLMKNENFCKALTRIKVMMFIGEKLPMELCRSIHSYSKCRIYDGYGPTEATVICTYKEKKEGEENKISIGSPMCNTKLYIVDKHLKIVPVGVEGEICISGFGTGSGYLNRKDLTKKKFVECPFGNGKGKYDDKYGKIMYRTGDLGKWNEEGEIDIIGRMDFQVKIHGQRIELGEIENTIKEIKGVEYVVVIDKTKENGDKYLICYYYNNGKEIDGNVIREYCKKKLPRYMVPHYYKKISKLPLTSNGKLDRKALPELSKEDFMKNDGHIAPETKTEKELCRIYSNVFKANEKRNRKNERRDSFITLINDEFDNKYNDLKKKLLNQKTLSKDDEDTGFLKILCKVMDIMIQDAYNSVTTIPS
ncbi:acetyl-CoA synthetase-like protein [Neocallimastix californiae]|uniref:Acetyl-CoA synthetase-like protein n=1 Tax=Neocallimastix californiae TaxID=1754190 RepID=A0A1Y2E223_9FUNG|nr:acetyl-CoA synthetase-like protein [Neocallimastix californiae]|eukprot:ORY65582.1 acetyl-CoA synthetase-like protein [Neocallimastix californiae]